MEVFRKKPQWQFYAATSKREGVTVGLSNMADHDIMIAVNFVDTLSAQLDSNSVYVDAATADRIADQLHYLARRLRVEEYERSQGGATVDA